MSFTKYDALSILEGLFTVGGLVVSALIFKEESKQDSDRMNEAKEEMKAYIDEQLKSRQ